jgi:hypothetical protein
VRRRWSKKEARRGRWRRCRRFWKLLSMFRSIRDREKKEARRVSATDRETSSQYGGSHLMEIQRPRSRSKWIRSLHTAAAVADRRRVTAASHERLSVKHPHPSPPDEEASLSPPAPPHRRPPGFASASINGVSPLC